MNLLAIDTVTENCSVALSLDSNPHTDTLERITPSGHSGQIHGMISQLLDHHGLGYAALDGIIVDTGPGSFTGVRIGIGVAQGLAYARGIGVMAVNSLQALSQTSNRGICIPAIDARMQQVYWAVYRCTEPVAEKLCGPFVSTPSDVRALLCHYVDLQEWSGPITGIGSGWDSYSESMPESVNGVEVDTVKAQFPGAESLIEMARRIDANDLPQHFVSPMQLMATYVRNEIVRKSASL